MNKSVSGFVFLVLVVVAVALPLYLLNEVRQLNNALDTIEQFEESLDGVKTDILEQKEDFDKFRQDFDRLKERIIGKPAGNVELT